MTRICKAIRRFFIDPAVNDELATYDFELERRGL